MFFMFGSMMKQMKKSVSLLTFIKTTGNLAMNTEMS